MANTVLLKSGTFEYVADASWGTFPTNPTMLWPGLVTKANATVKILTEEYRGLKAAGAADKLHLAGIAKVGQEIDIDVDWILQNWNLWKYVISSSGGTSTTDDLAGLSIGLISSDATPKYAKIASAKFDSIAVTIPKEKLARASGKMFAANITTASNNYWSVTNYKGSGANSSNPGTAPIKWGDITAFTFNGSAIPNSALGDVKFSVENHLERVPDAYATTTTKLGAIEPDYREFKVSATVTKKAIDALTAVADALTTANLVLTIGGTTFTWSNATINQDLEAFEDSGLSSLDVEFVGITDLALS